METFVFRSPSLAKPGQSGNGGTTGVSSLTKPARPLGEAQKPGLPDTKGPINRMANAAKNVADKAKNGIRNFFNDKLGIRTDDNGRIINAHGPPPRPVMGNN
jgi:hypothetical protein